MSATTIRCCQCKRITGVQEDRSAPYGGQTVYTFNPCFDCDSARRRQLERAAQIRQANAAAKAGRN